MENNRVLVIDDCHELLMLFKEVFSNDYDTMLVDSGHYGVQEVTLSKQTGEPFAIAFIDILMPGMDGNETARKIRMIDKDIYIVMMTGDDEGIVDDALSDRTILIRKPFSVYEISQLAQNFKNAWTRDRILEKQTRELRRREKSQRIINYFATSLSGSNTIEEITWDITSNCISQMGLEDAVVYLYNEERTQLKQMSAFGRNKAKNQEVLNPIVIPKGKGIVGSVALSGKTEIVDDVTLDARYIIDDDVRGSEITVPIIYENKTIGIIDSEHTKPNFFKAYHREILEAIASLAANKITRVKATKKLAESEAKYRSIFESIQDVYGEVDPISGMVLEVSPSVFNISGYTPSELIGRNIGDFVTNIPELSKMMDTISKDGKINDYQISLIDKAGSKKTVSFTALFSKENLSDKPIVKGTMRDITSRIKSEQEVRENEKRLKKILNTIPVGIILSDHDTRKISLANSASTKLIGLPAEKIIGMNAFDLLCETSREGCSLDHSSTTATMDLHLNRPDGIKTPILKTSVPINIHGRSFLLESFVDISIHKEAETALRQNLMTRNNFVANVSHELRTPLASILGFSGTMLRDTEMEENTKQEFTRIIFEESQRLTRLIENVLDLSRMESGTTNAGKKPIHLDSIVEEVIKTQVVLATKKQLKLVSRIKENIPIIMASADAMKQLATNLISNAIKFTEPGGCIEVELDKNQQQLMFKVKDNGLGIPEAEIDKIFDKFYRVNRPRREDQGTGIGLAIVKELVNQHDGQIAVESAVQKGTSFTVNLPLLTGASRA